MFLLPLTKLDGSLVVNKKGRFALQMAHVAVCSADQSMTVTQLEGLSLQWLTLTVDDPGAGRAYTKVGFYVTPFPPDIDWTRSIIESCLSFG